MAVVTPDEDATWPHCGIHGASGEFPNARHWCDWTRTLLLENGDAKMIDPGGRYAVPVAPALGLFAEASVDTDPVSEDMYLLALVTKLDPTDMFSDEERLDELGIWMPGEGRVVIAQSVNDWLEGMYEPSAKCEHFNHGFAQEVNLSKITRNTPEEKANWWCMVTERMCWPCHQAMSASGEPVPDFSASSYGLDDDALGTGGRGGETAAQRRTREALNRRFQHRSSNAWPGGPIFK